MIRNTVSVCNNDSTLGDCNSECDQVLTVYGAWRFIAAYHGHCILLPLVHQLTLANFYIVYTGSMDVRVYTCVFVLRHRNIACDSGSHDDWHLRVCRANNTRPATSAPSSASPTSCTLPLALIHCYCHSPCLCVFCICHCSIDYITLKYTRLCCLCILVTYVCYKLIVAEKSKVITSVKVPTLSRQNKF